MFEKLSAIFDKMNIPYFRQGSLKSIDEYKPEFFTFWNISSESGTHYENKEHTVIWAWNIILYSSNPGTMYDRMDDFISQAKEAGFIISGRGQDVPSDTDSHIGRMVQAYYIQNLEVIQNI